MTLLMILVGTVVAGVGSVWLAAWLSFGVLARYTQHMLSLAAGALLATGFIKLLPEAVESGLEPHSLFAVLLAALVFFFLLDKAELWHHGHEHHHGLAQESAEGHSHGHETRPAQGHDHAHRQHHGHPHAAAHHHAHPQAPAPDRAQGGGWAVLAGDSVHCFGDGILIASAFIADVHLGLIASLAVLAHEVPHHMGDLVVLHAGGRSRQTAIVKVSMAGAVTALGGLVGYYLVDALNGQLPYFLVVAASSFIYVALADLIPQLQKRLGARQTLAQVFWLAFGIAAVLAIGASGLGGHSH